MDGVESTILIKELEEQYNLPIIPIICCSAFDGQQDILNCKNAGMIEYLKKPLSLSKISIIIEKYI